MTQAQEPKIAVHIIATEMALALKGMTAPGSRYLTKGPKTRLWISLSVSQGHDRAKHHEAMIRNTVVGNPGTMTPSPASPTHPTPPVANSPRLARSGMLRRWSMRGVASATARGDGIAMGVLRMEVGTVLKSGRSPFDGRPRNDL